MPSRIRWKRDLLFPSLNSRTCGDPEAITRRLSLRLDFQRRRLPEALAHKGSVIAQEALRTAETGSACPFLLRPLDCRWRSCVAAHSIKKVCHPDRSGV